MLSPFVRKLFSPISVFLCVCILLTSLPGSVYRLPRRYTPYAAGTTPPGQSIAGEQGSVLQPVLGSGTGKGPAVPAYPYDPPPRPPGLAALLPLSGQTMSRVTLHSTLGAAVAMEPGWHLISLPEQPVDTDPATVLAPIAGSYARVYAYDGCDAADPWKLYDPADPASSDLTTIDHRMGIRPTDNTRIAPRRCGQGEPHAESADQHQGAAAASDFPAGKFGQCIF